ncbi:hypothetical protein [Bombilactobacillus thymidiniphilus]|uniref:Peptidase M60 domain-containing protein n=1 Tax=Bombilactobacillus thymidiniphilus TaxID=2923363 RepID=A0ABY4PDV7_9LACO|nr:hypothetical protein [Bombilactobacillus thymidiniphilus]UQS83679.1 hypothetical protein MOO47_00305 [Bombilactobacillus thymidiniphilus]
MPATKIHAQTTTSQTIQAIPKPTWIYNAGMSKGKYHDRQDLGFILPTNQELKVRQTNPNFTGKLTLRLLGNDSKLEKSVDINSNWVIIGADSPLVPFIDTPCGNTSATVEYQLTNNSKEKKLPIYEYHDNEHTFFQTWDQENSDFSLIKGKDFQLLIPKCDKELARNLKDFNNLDELLEHYNDLVSFYNKMAGFDNSSEVNQNRQNRYFLRADTHGAGGAYYK